MSPTASLDKSTRRAYPIDHACEAPGCTNPSPTAHTCSNACRAKVWKSEHNYVERRRGVRNASQRPQTRRQSRYLLAEKVDDRTLTILGEITASSKRSAERELRIATDPDTFVLAASHLPTIAA